MKNQMLLFLFITLILLYSIKIYSTKKNKELKFIINAKNNTLITYNDFINNIKNSDIVFFGETHDDTFSHKMEYTIYKSLMEEYNNTALGFEMFERDVQKILDKYLNDSIDESTFLSQSRPWNNYERDYKPILEYAKSKHLPVIAANIPRYLASIVAKKGEDSLNINKNGILFFKPYRDVKEYKKRFTNTMKELFNSQMHMAKTPNMNNLFLSQLYKDATMAYSINSFFDNNNDFNMFFICGEFHSNYHLGTVQQLSKMNKKLNIITIAVCNDTNHMDMEKADYIIIKNMYRDDK